MLPMQQQGLGKIRQCHFSVHWPYFLPSLDSFLPLPSPTAPRHSLGTRPESAATKPRRPRALAKVGDFFLPSLFSSAEAPLPGHDLGSVSFVGLRCPQTRSILSLKEPLPSLSKSLYRAGSCTWVFPIPFLQPRMPTSFSHSYPGL